MECFLETIGENVPGPVFSAFLHELVMRIAETVERNLAVEVVRGVKSVI